MYVLGGWEGWVGGHVSTHGDRRAAESRDLSRYNIDNKVSPHMVSIKAHWLVDQTPV